MKFYISPERFNEAQKKLDRMFKHLAVKPMVTYGSVEQVVKTTIIDQGIDGVNISREKIKAIQVEIEDIKAGDWVLVATVQYKQERYLMFDARYFKDIPEQYGLIYTKCDHCGSNHSNRNEAHILFNPTTGEWMQVGSTCIDKMINGGKYLNGLVLKLTDYFNLIGGCGDDEWRGGYWRPSYKYRYEVINIDEAMSYCLAYMNKYGTVWQKADWYDGQKISDSTNDKLIQFIKDKNSEREIDERLFEKVRSYFSTIERGIDDPYDGPNLTQKIIDAFINDFITIKEMYIAWFAISNYKNSISSQDFEDRINTAGIKKGMTLDIVAKVASMNSVTVCDWRGYECLAYDVVFEDINNGFLFTKTISSQDVINKYKCEDGLYRFECDIKYIAYKKQMIGISGRLRKQKAKKNKAE